MKTAETDEDADELANCFVCQQAIPDHHWFARIKLGDLRVLFCRPRCMEALLKENNHSNQNDG
jgi:hypothetical protein